MEIGETETGQLFIAMTFYEGCTLKERLLQSPLALETVLRYIVAIAEGLEFSHRQGVVHRDIKPSNIVITKDDNVKIVDFGLATIVNRPLPNDGGRIMGTVGYMPPEQLRGKQTDFRADIWSTGIVLHEMLYGNKPDRTNYGSIDLDDAPSKSSSSAGSAIISHLHGVMVKALQNDPNDRYPSMSCDAQGCAAGSARPVSVDVVFPDCKKNRQNPAHRCFFGHFFASLFRLCHE